MKKYLILLLFSVGIAFSHDLWLEKKDNFYTLFYGHLNPSDNDQKSIEYNPNSVFEIKCFSQDGKEKSIKVERSYPLKIFGKCDSVFIGFSSGYWTKTPYGLKNLPKNQVHMPLESWKSVEYVKRLDTDINKPLTANLEITPLDSIKNVKIGDKITFLVTLNAKPVKDTVVAYDEKPIGTTDDEGKINIRIKRSGIQNISTSLKLKEVSEKADFTIYTSTLNFEVK
ncbi:DUF4198 domain-containing protein [Sulfurihydrogenibium azorense]|uniref:Nickel transport complex, NikM subunit, transmembrane n=1 Tax=Sulfurihydrogenibium azorense (strain DSM 15241 / OCM 825 / Az-Fu1) TaxID=204536 RepID=C1DUD7_SULAA|nr:DUF4198 domain-containing protein [Sulfurihydrogenibium azorense]ACN98533.1 conserved hypothetical protein [Sulfurihydrogenibium azorense Az-Fu1]